MSEQGESTAQPPGPPPAPPGGPLPPPGWQPSHHPSDLPGAALGPVPPTGPVGPPPPVAAPQPGYPVAPPAYGYPAGPGGYTPWPQAPRNDGMAIAALSCGIVSIPLVLFCFLGLIVGIVGLVLGLISLSRIRNSGGTLAGRGMALAGTICGGVGTGLSLLYVVLIIAVSL
jgi:hypothetical protein